MFLLFLTKQNMIIPMTITRARTITTTVMVIWKKQKLCKYFKAQCALVLNIEILSGTK
jgi:RAB protein geranylgeranyltransferase component A